jgi:penicillin-binding protein 1C
VTVGVWVGNFNRTPLRNSSGVTGAGPIFHAVMLAAERRLESASTAFSNEPILAAPATSVQREICALSGLTANQWCPNRRREWVAADAPSVPCSWHHVGEDGLVTYWPAEFREWARTHGHDVADGVDSAVALAARSGEAGTTAAGAHARQAALTIVSPPDGATYLIDPTLRREFQTLSLKAISRAGRRIEWSVAGRVVGSAESDGAVDWPLVPGQHRIVARDDQGRTAETTVVVR